MQDFKGVWRPNGPWPEKLQRAHFGLWSEGCLEVLHDQVRSVLRSLRAT
jgi:hypothetical protein